MTKYQLITPPTFFNELLGLPGKIQKLVTQKVKILEHDPVSAQGDAKNSRIVNLHFIELELATTA